MYLSTYISILLSPHGSFPQSISSLVWTLPISTFTSLPANSSILISLIYLFYAGRYFVQESVVSSRLGENCPILPHTLKVVCLIAQLMRSKNALRDR